jgi:uncharacterized membrane protein YphA (DoxX/SURF4 family)
MKIVINIARIIVGVLFIFSGLVKANDPMGLSYKMQEFFEIWGLHQFNNLTLPLSILMNAFEIIAGFALLMGWGIRVFSWMLLLLILFFTFLTGYTYFTGQPKNCGCFGDCLPITSKQSFLKDVVLTLLIGILFINQKYIKPLISVTANNLLMLGITLFSFGFQWYTLAYLPVVDCLPYKKGNNINEKMKMPPNAVPDSTIITFVYNKGGKEIEFTADKFPSDFNKDTYTFIKRYDKLVRKGSNNEPPIKGFSLSGSSNSDSTQYVLNQPYSILLFCEKFSDAGESWKTTFEKIYQQAKEKNINSYIITAEPADAPKVLKGTGFESVQVFKCDYKAIQTAARSNPCIYLLKNGTVQNKFSSKNMSNISSILSEIPVQQPNTIITNDPVPDSEIKN